MGNAETPITPGERAVLEQLEEYLQETDPERLTREAALSCLTEQGLGRTEASNRVDQLLLKGYLYEVNDELRIPSRSK